MNRNSKNVVRLTKSELRDMIKESVKQILRETEEEFALNDVAYDRNGNEIHEGDFVLWVDPETGRKSKYQVYEEPTADMVKLWSKYGECEAYPEECIIIKR